MKRLLPLLVVVVLALVLNWHVARVQAYPKPSVAPVAWELDFENAAPTRIAVTVPGEQAPRVFWYMTFKVSNNTDQEQDFWPVIELVDDKGNIHRSDKGIPQAAFDAIKQRERNPHLLPLVKASGRLLPGGDQAKFSVAIWPEPQERMGSFQVFIGGLSGEAVWVKDGKEVPMKKADWTTTKDPKDADKQAMGEVLKGGQVLFKTLELEYQVPGDEFYQGRDPVIRKKRQWIMR